MHLRVVNFIFYMMQLKGAEALGKPARELAVIHVSLAATYVDLAQHSKAVEHYRQELALRQGSSTEVFITSCIVTIHNWLVRDNIDVTLLNGWTLIL